MQPTMALRIRCAVTAMLSHFPLKFLSSTHYLMAFRRPDAFIPLFIADWILNFEMNFLFARFVSFTVGASDSEWERATEQRTVRERGEKEAHEIAGHIYCQNVKAFEARYAKAMYEHEAFLFVSHLTMCLHIMNLLDAKTKSPFSALEWHK